MIFEKYTESPTIEADLKKLARRCRTEKEFEKEVTYYGIQNKREVDVALLNNTERVNPKFNSVTKGPIVVEEDMRNGKLYIIEGHHRALEAKNRGDKKITAVVSRTAGRNGETEATVYLRNKGINIKDFYKSIKR